MFGYSYSYCSLQRPLKTGTELVHFFQYLRVYLPTTLLPASPRNHEPFFFGFVEKITPFSRGDIRFFFNVVSVGERPWILVPGSLELKRQKAIKADFGLILSRYFCFDIWYT